MNYQTVMSSRVLFLAKDVVAHEADYPYEIRDNAKALLKNNAVRREAVAFMWKHHALTRTLRRAMRDRRVLPFKRHKNARNLIASLAGPDVAKQLSTAVIYAEKHRQWQNYAGERLRALLQVLHYPDIALMHRYMECALSKTSDASVAPVQFLYHLEGAWIAETLCWRLLQLSKVPALVPSSPTLL